MENTEKRIIEVNGVKLEVDLSQCRVVENYHVGMPVKVLRKKYGNDFISSPGMIVGFDNFQSRPTIIVAYLQIEYSSAELGFIYYNSDTKDVEICPMNAKDIPIKESEAVGYFNREIAKKETELKEIKAKKAFFLSEFGKTFKFETEKTNAE